jgi:hypothetical protein
MTVTADTIATALGRDTYSTAEDAQWSLWIADALLLIEARLGDPAELDQARLDYVVREAVLAHIRHPDDATQVSVSIDDATSSRTYRSGKGRVSILEEWWSLLSPDDEDGGAFVLDMLGTSTNHLPWCAAVLGANYCSCGADIAGTPIYELGGWV